MAHYRCYLLNSTDNIVTVDSIEAEDDQLAMSLAAGLLVSKFSKCAAIEVWHQKKCVGRISSQLQNPTAEESLLSQRKATNQS